MKTMYMTSKRCNWWFLQLAFT